MKSNHLYRLSPTGFRVFGAICILLVSLSIVLYYVHAIKRNQSRIRRCQREKAEEARAATAAEAEAEGGGRDNRQESERMVLEVSNTVGGSSYRSNNWKGDAHSGAFLETLALCLWCLLFHLSIFKYTKIPTWPFFFLFIFAIFRSIQRIDNLYPVQFNSNRKQADAGMNLLGVLSVFAAIQFFLVSAQQCFHLAPLAVYDYYGPVRVIGYNPSYIGRDGRQNMLPRLRKYYFKCPVDEAVGQIQVAWGGGDWACGGKECKAMVHSFHCDFVVCETCNGGCLEEEYTNTLQESNYCVQNWTYFQDSWDLLDEGISYDKTVSPENDSNQFATEIMYANCDTCQAEFKDIVDQQREGNFPFRSLLIFLGVLVAFLSFSYFILAMKNKE